MPIINRFVSGQRARSSPRRPFTVYRSVIRTVGQTRGTCAAVRAVRDSGSPGLREAVEDAAEDRGTVVRERIREALVDATGSRGPTMGGGTGQRARAGANGHIGARSSVSDARTRSVLKSSSGYSRSWRRRVDRRRGHGTRVLRDAECARVGPATTDGRRGGGADLRAGRFPPRWGLSCMDERVGCGANRSNRVR